MQHAAAKVKSGRGATSLYRFFICCDTIKIVKIFFIYVYTDTAGKPVYVGSTFDVKTRDRIRRLRPGCPFDRELQSNPKSYSLSIVEAGRGSNEDRVNREAQWMDVLGTFRTPHGYNFQRPTVTCYDRNAWLAARQKSQTTPEALAKKAASQTVAMSNRKAERKARIQRQREESILATVLLHEEYLKRKRKYWRDRQSRLRDASRPDRIRKPRHISV